MGTKLNALICNYKESAKADFKVAFEPMRFENATMIGLDDKRQIILHNGIGVSLGELNDLQKVSEQDILLNKAGTRAVDGEPCRINPALMIGRKKGLFVKVETVHVPEPVSTW